jgi:hypothetical protein
MFELQSKRNDNDVCSNSAKCPCRCTKRGKETYGDAKVNILLHFGLIRLNSVYGYSTQEVYVLARGHLVRKTALNWNGYSVWFEFYLLVYILSLVIYTWMI